MVLIQLIKETLRFEIFYPCRVALLRAVSFFFHRINFDRILSNRRDIEKLNFEIRKRGQFIRHRLDF